MKPITKDTPVGTRVLCSDAGELKRGTLAAVTTDRATVVYDGDDGWGRRLLLSSVYLDEPAPGTTAWALEQVAAGYATQRKLYDGIYMRMLIDGQKLVVEWLNAGQPEPDSLDLDDITATDWEIAK